MKTEDRAVLDEALALTERGLPVFPVHRPTEKGCSCRKTSCSQVGKHPATSDGFKSASLDRDQVRKWWGPNGRFSGYNIGVLCGIAHICVDVDPKNYGLDSLEELVKDIGALPDTWVEETGEDDDGRRGLHYWYKIPESLKGQELRTKKPLPGYSGIDFLATNQYAIVAPSAHRSGTNYETLTDPKMIVDAPEELLNLVIQGGDDGDLFPKAGELLPSGLRPGPEIRHFLRHGDVPPGGQTDMIVKAARALWGLWVDMEESVDLIFDAIQKCDQSREPWTRSQIHYHVAHVYSAEPKDLDLALDGTGNTDFHRAQKLFEFSRGRIRYCSPLGAWFYWDATRWKEDSTLHVHRLVNALGVSMLQKAAFIEDDDIRRTIIKQSQVLHQHRGAMNVINKAASLGEVSVTPAEFDRDKMLINASNCIVDLRTGRTSAQDPGKMMSKSTRAEYYPESKSPLWEATVLEACGGDQVQADFLKLAFGYAITGETVEDCFFYLHGPGGTGKTTVLEAISYVLGSYSTSADPETFMLADSSFPGSTRADLAALRGKRWVVSSEIAQGSRFSSATINRLTGRDLVSARIPYAKMPLIFKPEWTLMFAANHFPTVPGSGRRDGFWRRVKVLPFERKLKTEEMNTALPHLLAQKEHMNGILTWLVEGAIEWWTKHGSQNKKLEVPDRVKRATEDVQNDADYMNEFYEMLEIVPGARVPKQAVFELYGLWAQRNGFDHTLTKWSFSRKLKDALGLVDKNAQVEGKVVRAWIDLEIRDDVRERLGYGEKSQGSKNRKTRSRGSSRKAARG